MIWLAYLSAYLSVVPFVYGIMKYKVVDQQFKLAVGYFILIFITEVITSTLSLLDLNNAFISNIFYLLEGAILFIYFVQFYSLYIFSSILVLVFYTALWIYLCFYQNKFSVYNSDFRTVESILILILSGITLLKLTKKSAVSVFKNHHLILAFGVFLYFGVNLVLFYSTKILISIKSEFVTDIWVVHSITNIFTISLFTYALMMIKPTSNNEWRS